LVREYLLPSALLLPFNALPDKTVTYFIYAVFVLLAFYALARTIEVERPRRIARRLLLRRVRSAGLIASLQSVRRIFQREPILDAGCWLLNINHRSTLGGWRYMASTDFRARPRSDAVLFDRRPSAQVRK
jgi:hypothetical protein